MVLIDNFPEAEPEPGDWLLVQKINPNRYHKIPLGKVGGQSSVSWILKSSTATTVDSGAKAVLDNRLESWTISLPLSPKSGDEIQLLCLGKKALKLNFNNRPFRGTVSNKLGAIFLSNTTEETFERLIYLGDVMGWIDVNGRIGIFEDYYNLVNELSRFAHYRMSHTDPAIVSDVTGINQGLGVGSFELQQPSLLASDPNPSCSFIGTNSYVRVNSAAIAGPNNFTIELLLKTSVNTGGLVGFSNLSTPGGGSFDRELRINGGFVQGYIYPGGTITSNVKVNDNVPHVVTYSVGSFGQKIWIDGALVASGTSSAAAAYSGFWKLGHSTELNAYYRGTLDEVFISHASAVEADVVRRHRAALGRK